MLYLETSPGSGSFVPWDGKAIGDLLPPPDIEAHPAWTDADREAIGLYKPVDPGIPDGKLEVSRSVQRVDDVVQFVYELADAPALTRIPKDIIWRRATEEEADIMDGLMAAQSARLRNIYAGANYVSTEDEFYPTLLGGLVAAFGEPRALELLEPVE